MLARQELGGRQKAPNPSTPNREPRESLLHVGLRQCVKGESDYEFDPTGLIDQFL